MQSADFTGYMSIYLSIYLKRKIICFLIKPLCQSGISPNYIHLLSFPTTFTWTCLFLYQFFWGFLWRSLYHDPLCFPCSWCQTLPRFDSRLAPPSPLATFSDQTYEYDHLNSTFPDNVHFLFFPVSWVNKPAGAEGQHEPGYSSRTGGC